MADALPAADLVVLPDCGHMSMLERHELANLNLRRLLSRALTTTTSAA
jgi:pimeloyl-ACP methyl ester carboxylesterase